MAIVKTKPTSPGRRFVVKVVNKDLHKGTPVRALTESKNKSGGRNNNGRITTRHVGGGEGFHTCNKYVSPRNIDYLYVIKCSHVVSE